MNYYIEVLKKYTVFVGRARRKEYWMFFLFNILISIAISIVEAVLNTGSILGGIYGLAILLPAIGVSIRRLHDTNRSGWWLLISLVPLVGTIVLIVFLATDSQPGVNQYGPNPKESSPATSPA